MALLDGGAAALAVASGQSAISLSLLNIAQAGDEIVSADNLYGGTYTLFQNTFKKFGIRVTFVKSNDLAAFEKAITPKTKAVYAESIGNPKLDIADLEGIAKITRQSGRCGGKASFSHRYGQLTLAWTLLCIPPQSFWAGMAHLWAG